MRSIPRTTLLGTITALAVGAAAMLEAQVGQPASNYDEYASGREIVAGLDRIVTPRGIDETFTATLGGTKQVVNVRGSARGNPILIYVHGGPGAVEMPFAWTFQRPWEDFFTVVQWDQRGAGRSYLLNDPKTLAPMLTVDRYRDDAIDLINLLRRRYGKRKVFLLGHSWGSVIGLSVAMKRPDLLQAYIGMGQYIAPVEQERIGFDWVLGRARQDGNAEAVRELEALRPYPGDFSIDRIDAQRKWVVHYGGLFAYRDSGQFYFRAARLSPQYTPADIKAWDDGSSYSVTRVEPQIARISFANLTKLDCPIFMFEGRHDHVIPSAVTAAWLDRVKAPTKRTIWFEHSGHMMMVEEPGRMLAALLEYVRPLATQADAVDAYAEKPKDDETFVGAAADTSSDYRQLDAGNQSVRLSIKTRTFADRLRWLG